MKLTPRELTLAPILATVLAFCLSFDLAVQAASDVQEDPALVKLVEADWAFQEKQRDRTPDNPAAIGDLLSRAEKLFADLKPSAPLKSYIEKFQELKQKAQDLDQLDTEARRALYHELRWTLRRAALNNPLVAETPIAFLKRRRFACQMLHEYLGYYYQRSGTDGGEVCILKNPGFDMSIDRLTEGHLPKGAYTTLALSHDAKRLYFAFADMSEVKNRPSKPIHWKALSAQGSARDAWNAHLKEEKRMVPPLLDQHRRKRPATIDLRSLRRFRPVPAARWEPGLHVLPTWRIWPLSRGLGSRCRSTRSIDSGPTVKRSTPCPITKPTNGTRRSFPTAESSTVAGTTSIAGRPVTTASGSPTRTEPKRAPCLATTP